ncbi:VIER F-box protein 2 [Tanacetum coccineum]
MKVIKEGSKKLGLFKIDDDSFACNSPLGITFDEFNLLSGMDDNLFTYEVEIPGLPTIPSDMKEEDDSNDGDLFVYKPRVCYDENNGIYTEAVIFVNKRLVRLMDVIVEQWLGLIYGDHKKVDVKVKEEIYWTRGDDEVELTNEEFSDPDNENLIDKDEVTEIFRIETDVFDFETPICKAFNEFNYLLKINTDSLTSDILKFKTYDEFKNEWMDEWNKGIPWVPEEPWSENGIPIDYIHYICEPFHFKNGKAKWPT